MTDQDAPGPETLTDEELSKFLSDHLFGGLATTKRSGHPHLSTVLYKWDPDERIARVSSTKDRLKVRQLRNNPRAALFVTSRDNTTYAVVEGTAELAETTEPGDEAGRELLAMGFGLPQPTEHEAFVNQVEEGRVVIRLRAERVYGMALDLPQEMREL
jgi:PPOX class probable F420-dependent enzyme